MLTTKQFADTLTRAEKTYLWDHVHRYAVENSTAKELVEYVLNFFDGDSEIETKIFAKAMKAFGG